jgi:hypothetical protein
MNLSLKKDEYEICTDSIEEIGANLLCTNKENNHKDSLFSQRVTFYCIPIPGENDWVKNVCFYRIIFLL